MGRRKSSSQDGLHGRFVDCPLFRGKKGISPFIATILLVAFTVAIAAFLKLWSGNTEELMARAGTPPAEVSCGQAELRIVSCSFVPDDSGGYALQMLVKNSGKMVLGDLHMVAIYEGDAVYDYAPTEKGATIKPVEYKKLIASGTVDSSAAKQVLIETGTCPNVRDSTTSCTLANAS